MGAVTYVKNLHDLNIVVLCIKIYLYFIYNIVLFLNILFICNTLSKSILLIIGIIFNMSLGPDENV
jgi:hypothetical protein